MINILNAVTRPWTEPRMPQAGFFTCIIEPGKHVLLYFKICLESDVFCSRGFIVNVLFFSCVKF